MLTLGNHSYGVYIVILAGYIAVTYLTFPETRHLTIEEISAVFEGNGPAHGAASLQRVAYDGDADLQNVTAIKSGETTKSVPTTAHVE